MSEINMDNYIRNLRILYFQLIKGHIKEQILVGEFKKMVDEQTKNWRKRNGYLRAKANEQIIAVEQNSLLGRVKSLRNVKSKPKLQVDGLYYSPKIESCIVFGYIFLILELKNVAAFNFIQQNLEESIKDKSLFTEANLRRINFIWDKLHKIVSGEKRIFKLQKTLQECFKQINQNFIDLLYFIIIQGHDYLFSTDKDVYLENLVKILNISIIYFEASSNELMKNKTFGEFKYNIKIGYIIKEKLFCFVTKIPQKQQTQIKKQITLEKFGLIATKLTKLYQSTTQDYLKLQTLKRAKKQKMLELSQKKQKEKQQSQFQLRQI